MADLSYTRNRFRSVATHLPDPADAKFIEVANTARADYLVTGNIRHFRETARDGCPVVTPRQLVEALL